MPLPSYFEPGIANLRALIDRADTEKPDRVVELAHGWLKDIQNSAGPSHGLAAAQAGIENVRLAIEDIRGAQAEPDADEEQVTRETERRRAIARNELDKLVELLEDIPPSERAEP